MNDKYWMQLAYEFALQAQAQGEVPVGAVLVDENNNLLASGWNQVIINHDPTAHAELIAIKAAAQVLKNHRLLNTTLYVTLEPCAMCAAALVHARIKRLVFATRDIKAGAAGSVFNLVGSSLLNHRIQIDEGCLEALCSHLLSDFFREKR